MRSPIETYLHRLHDKYARLEEGTVADYIPELGKARPEWFGIAIATVDGQLYEVGDSQIPFTIQSISKPIVFGLAMETWGLKHVMGRVGVEPSGEAFNSISLDPRSGRPLNPMINAGAIAATSLVRGDTPEEKLGRLLETFSALAGRPVTVDEAVYRSERDSGHRNRAIAHLLRNFEILDGDPEGPLDLYFRQCAISVTCADLARIAAGLANGGVNPATGRRVFRPHNVGRLLSIMSTCGMYDFAGEWIFNVGMPAKSGVAGGIMAVLPGQLGIGVFSPPLDARGNSVRGIRVCSDLSGDFGLHLFNTPRIVTPPLRGAYTAAEVRSKRVRSARELEILHEHGAAVRIFDLRGRLLFASLELAMRPILDQTADATHVILDLDRVIDLDRASCRLLLELQALLANRGKRVHLTGIADKVALRDYVISLLEGGGWEAFLCSGTRDDALEACEDDLLRKAGCVPDASTDVPLADQELCADFSPGELQDLSSRLESVEFPADTVIFAAGDPSDSMFFITRGEVAVLISSDEGSDQLLSRLTAGMSVGEMALVDRKPRSATVRTTAPVKASRLPFPTFDRLPDEGLGHVQNKLLGNLARVLSHRLRSANAEIRSLR
jgi:glutaminase